MDKRIQNLSMTEGHVEQTLAMLELLYNVWENNEDARDWHAQHANIGWYLVALQDSVRRLRRDTEQGFRIHHANRNVGAH